MHIEILLGPEVLIGSDKDLKALSRSCCQQFTIFQGASATLEHRFHLMRVQEFAQRYGRPLIKEYAHSGNLGRSQAFRCMVEHRPHLLGRNAREPLNELGNLRPIFEILEKGADRDPRATKYPCATDTLRVTFDR